MMVAVRMIVMARMNIRVDAGTMKMTMKTGVTVTQARVGVMVARMKVDNAVARTKVDVIVTRETAVIREEDLAVWVVEDLVQEVPMMGIQEVAGMVAVPVQWKTTGIGVLHPVAVIHQMIMRTKDKAETTVMIAA